LRALKNIFAWCCDTRQCQDVILRNQRRQNEKMGIDDFEEFPLLEPPLVEDHFASLSAIDLAAMEAATDASGSEYEDDGEDNKDNDE
jgi:hypothetical protein